MSSVYCTQFSVETGGVIGPFTVVQLQVGLLVVWVDSVFSKIFCKMINMLHNRYLHSSSYLVMIKVFQGVKIYRRCGGICCLHDWGTVYTYTERPRRNVPDFGRMFLMLKYTEITQNTPFQSWTVTEIMAREKCGLLAGPRTIPVSWQVLSTFVRECGVILP
jgi:hypothetical protein